MSTVTLLIIFRNRPPGDIQSICVKLENIQSATCRRRSLSLTMFQNWIKWDIMTGIRWSPVETSNYCRGKKRNYETQLFATFASYILAQVAISNSIKTSNDLTKHFLPARSKAARKEQIETIKRSKVKRSHYDRKQIIHFAFIKLYHYILKLINMKMKTYLLR